MRTSTDQLDKNGMLINGYDYDLQVWVKSGIIIECGHPKSMGMKCCNQRRYAGKLLKEVK